MYCELKQSDLTKYYGMKVIDFEKQLKPRALTKKDIDFNPLRPPRQVAWVH